MKHTWTQNDLCGFRPQKRFLAAVDSDGCVFDSMTIKQRIFHSGMIRFWNLESIEKEFRRIAEWIALFSPWRGLNRFELLLRILKTLEKNGIRPAPDFLSLEKFVNSGVPLSADKLTERAAETGDPDLTRILDWSRAVSTEIAAIEDVPVFDEAPETLKAVRESADIIVVSQTAEEALVREWKNAGLGSLIDIIAGAELGSKAGSLQTIMKDRYPADRTLMVGDAPGDLEAARSSGSFFFPIIPGEENRSWIELRQNGLKRLLDGTFAGSYEKTQIDRFTSVLKRVPAGLHI